MVHVRSDNRRGSPAIEHIGLAHSEAELEALKGAAWQRMMAGHGSRDLDQERADPRTITAADPLPDNEVTESAM